MGIHPLVPPSANASTMLAHHGLSFGLKEKKRCFTARKANVTMLMSRRAQVYVNIPKKTDF